MLNTSTQIAIKNFLTSTNNMSCDAATYDAAYQVLSNSIEDFNQFEAACMELGIA